MSRQVFLNGFSILILLSIQQQLAANEDVNDNPPGNGKKEPGNDPGATLAQIQGSIQRASRKSVRQSSIATSLKGLVSNDLAARRMRKVVGTSGKGSRSTVYLYDLTEHGIKEINWMMACIDQLRSNS